MFGTEWNLRKWMREVYTFCVVNIERLRIQIDLKIVKTKNVILMSYSILKFMKQFGEFHKVLC